MTVAHEVATGARDSAARRIRPDIRIGLLGVGHVGSAIVRMTLPCPDAPRRIVRVIAGLVRDPFAPGRRVTEGCLSLTADAEAVFDSGPDVIVEVLGGLEPARTLVLEALARGIPVVTANKSLLAHHGDELLEAAATAEVPLRYEAAVVAGVPFLGTFARRPLASRISAITGIVNGTTNYILSEMHDRSADFATALARAQRNGFAEPDPSKDIDGFDAVEKLVILVRQFMRLRIAPADVATSGIRGLTVADLTHAREFGGCLKPVVYATQSGTAVTAFAGPAFVPSAHPLAQVPGASNGVCVRDELASQVCFTGPGAGPDVTAVTILDDVVEAVEERAAAASATRRATVISPIGAWLVRLTSRERLPEAADVAGVFGAQGVWLQRASSLDTRTGTHARWFLTYPCGRDRLENATTALTAAARCSSYVMDALSPEP